MAHPVFFAAAVLVAAVFMPATVAAQALGGAERHQPLARFADPICPGVAGMEVEVAEAIVGRIRQNSEALGLALADPASCEPNVIVNFLEDGRDYIAGLKAKQGWMFVDMTEQERKALFDAPGNVRAWLRTVVRSRDGMPISRREALDQIPETTMWMAHSRIYVATRRDSIAAMILIDRDAAEGRSIFQLGDYATMRALGGETFRKFAPDGGTILALFEPGENRPRSMTPADWVYLETLYGSQPNLPAALTLATVQSRISALQE